MSADRYMVIESTPGYLPDDDHPATFSDLSEARVYAQDLVCEICDEIYEGEAGLEGCFTIEGSFQEDLSVTIYDRSKTHDLGRVVEIIDLIPPRRATYADLRVAIDLF